MEPSQQEIDQEMRRRSKLGIPLVIFGLIFSFFAPAHQKELGVLAFVAFLFTAGSVGWFLWSHLFAVEALGWSILATNTVFTIRYVRDFLDHGRSEWIGRSEYCIMLGIAFVVTCCVVYLRNRSVRNAIS